MTTATAIRELIDEELAEMEPARIPVSTIYRGRYWERRAQAAQRQRIGAIRYSLIVGRLRYQDRIERQREVR